MKVSFVINEDLRYSYRATEMLVYEYAKFMLEHGIDSNVIVADLTGIPFKRRTPLTQRQDWDRIKKRFRGVTVGRVGGYKISFPFEYAPITFYRHLPSEPIIYMPFNIFSYAVNAFTKPASQRYVISTYGMNLRKKRKHGAFLKAINRFTSGILFWLLLQRRGTRENIYYQAINSTHRDYFIHHGVKKENIFLIPLSINTKNFKPKLNQPMRTNRLRITHIGGLDKDAEVVVEIIKKLIDMGKLDDFEFYMIGNKEPQELLDYATKYKNIHLLGPIGDVEKATTLSNVDVLIAPDKVENFAITLVEGLSCGVYPIASAYNLGAKDMKASGANLYMADKTEEYIDLLIKLHKLKGNRRSFNEGKLKNIKISNLYSYDTVFPMMKKMFEKVSRGESSE